ncbi:MAG: IS4 family transposase, partial [Marinilabiliales bacterium]
HGRRAMSFFKYGLNFFAHVILNRKTVDYKKCIKLLSCT